MGIRTWLSSIPPLFFKRERAIIDIRPDQSEVYDKTPETKPAIDIWTFNHFAGGMVLGFFQSRKTVTAENLAWEALEVVLAKSGYTRFHEPLDNKAIDIIAVELGAALSRKIKKEID